MTRLEIPTKTGKIMILTGSRANHCLGTTVTSFQKVVSFIRDVEKLCNLQTRL